MPTITKLYSMKEASEHNTQEDCWVVIDGKVYDVTKYLDEHPGGDDVLLSATGRDSIEEFEDAGHSESARELMQEYCIGEIDPTPAIPELEIIRKDQPFNLITKFSSKTLQYWTVPAAIVGISVVAAILYSRKK